MRFESHVFVMNFIMHVWSRPTNRSIETQCILLYTHISDRSRIDQQFWQLGVLSPGRSFSEGLQLQLLIWALLFSGARRQRQVARNGSCSQAYFRSPGFLGNCWGIKQWRLAPKHQLHFHWNAEKNMGGAGLASLITAFSGHEVSSKQSNPEFVLRIGTECLNVWGSKSNSNGNSNLYESLSKLLPIVILIICAFHPLLSSPNQHWIPMVQNRRALGSGI